MLLLDHHSLSMWEIRKFSIWHSEKLPKYLGYNVASKKLYLSKFCPPFTGHGFPIRAKPELIRPTAFKSVDIVTIALFLNIMRSIILLQM